MDIKVLFCSLSRHNCTGNLKAFLFSCVQRDEPEVPAVPRGDGGNGSRRCSNRSVRRRDHVRDAQQPSQQIRWCSHLEGQKVITRQTVNRFI
jgi:hypothetical protein